jgi:hypothetical protein
VGRWRHRVRVLILLVFFQERVYDRGAERCAGQTRCERQTRSHRQTRRRGRTAVTRVCPLLERQTRADVVFRGWALTDGRCRVVLEDGVLEDLDGLLMAALLLGLLGSRWEAQRRGGSSLSDLGGEIDFIDLGDRGRRVRDRSLLYAERERLVGVLWKDVKMPEFLGDGE